jgi:hypothetical protein
LVELQILESVSGYVVARCSEYEPRKASPIASHKAHWARLAAGVHYAISVPAGRAAGWTLHMFPEADGDDAGLAAVDQVAVVLGVTVRDDTARGGHYRARRSFGLVAYEFVHVPDAYRAASAARQSYEANISAALVPGDVAA